MKYLQTINNSIFIIYDEIINHFFKSNDYVSLSINEIIGVYCSVFGGLQMLFLSFIFSYLIRMGLIPD